MSDLPGETHAIAVAMNVARQYGYGNLISRLQDAWSKHLQDNSSLSKGAADSAAWKPSWFWEQIDTLKARNALLEKVAERAALVEACSALETDGEFVRVHKDYFEHLQTSLRALDASEVKG